MTIKRRCQVIADYTCAYPDPLKARKGETLSVERRESEWPGWLWVVNDRGRGGWIPESYLDRSGNAAIVLRDYDATELSVSVGETLTIEDEESGWLWVVGDDGRPGWVPLANVEIL